MLTPVSAVLLALLLSVPTGAPHSVTASDLAGTWVGALTHDGDSTVVAFGFAPDTTGRVAIEYTLPALHFDRVLLGAPRLVAAGDSVRLGPFRFAFDRERGTLTGVMPAVFFPAYDIPVSLRRGVVAAPPGRPAALSNVRPRWTFTGDSAMWAGPTCETAALAGDGVRGDVIYVGTLAGTVYALRERDGSELWRFRAGGAIRSRPSHANHAVYVEADDGWLYRIDSRNGALVWKVKLMAQPVVRLPFSDPKSRYDRFGPDVTVSAGRLYAGTYDGRVVALSCADGHVLWEFATGDAVLAAPALAGDRVIAGSYDHFVYALDAATGKLAWKCDTHGRVVSTPAIAGDRVVVGNRIYDLLGLDLRTGAVAWRRYQWGTWVESSATARDGIAYVGSSDGACVSAWDVKSGKRLWLSDVLGWSWGQPAVTADRVYQGASGQVGYPIDNHGALVALDRAGGHVAWRFAPAQPAEGDWGFAGSPAVGTRFVYASTLEGKVYAFER